ncbi:MAG: EF-P lysine aminoacylase GenX [Lentisphaerae bacterium]|nr:EF-P lysine aminoacylase GenX [Lentisphaerota bacterium]
MRQVLEVRSRVLQAVRRFFAERGFIEAETPVRLAAPAPEEHIEAEPAGGAYLRTSPELYLKRLLAEGWPRVFEMGPCFRRGEAGRLHQPEYTMLEWYRAGADYLDVLADTKTLLAAAARAATGGTRVTYRGETIELLPVWDCLTVRDAFLQFAGWDPVAACDADRFDVDLVGKVEPALPRDRPVVLKDYPAARAALARCRPGAPPVAERWELYAGGMELANAFSELTDAEEQRRRFEAANAARRARGAPAYPLDEAFLGALERGLPPCAGVALGIDRLVMLLSGCESVEDTRTFCFAER